MRAILRKEYEAEGLCSFDFPEEIKATVTPELKTRIDGITAMLADDIWCIELNDFGLDFEFGDDFRVGHSCIKVSKYGLTLNIQGKYDCSAEIEYDLTILGRDAQ